MTAVQTERKSLLDCDDPYKPIVRRQTNGKVGQSTWPLRQDAHEPNDFRTGWLAVEWIPGDSADHFASTANHDLGFKRQPPKKFSAQFCLTDRVADYERPGRADIDDVTPLQLFREDAWPKGPVPANVHALQKNDLPHRLRMLIAKRAGRTPGEGGGEGGAIFVQWSSDQSCAFCAFCGLQFARDFRALAAH